MTDKLANDCKSSASNQITLVIIARMIRSSPRLSNWAIDCQPQSSQRLRPTLREKLTSFASSDSKTPSP